MIQRPDYDALVRDAEIGRQLARAFPSIHAEVVRELESARVKPRDRQIGVGEQCPECSRYYGAHSEACSRLDRNDPDAVARARESDAYDETSHGAAF